MNVGTTCDSPCNVILGRLQNKRKYQDGWRADCPVREHKSDQTVWVSERDDGSVGLHCFAGCTPLNVVHSLGLEMKDLFPRPVGDLSPSERRVRRQWGKISKYAAALSSLEFAARIIWLAGCDVRDGAQLTDSDLVHLGQAIESVENARSVFNG